MPSVPERERVYPPYQLHLRCSPHFGCPSPALDPRILWISVCPTAHVFYTGDPRLCSQLCEIRKQHIPTFARALFPGHPSSAFCDSSQETGVAGSFISTVLPISHIPRHAFWSSFQPAGLLTGAIVYHCYTAHCERWAFHAPAKLTPHSFPSKWALFSVQPARAWRAPN